MFHSPSCGVPLERSFTKLAVMPMFIPFVCELVYKVCHTLKVEHHHNILKNLYQHLEDMISLYGIYYGIESKGIPNHLDDDIHLRDFHKSYDGNLVFPYSHKQNIYTLHFLLCVLIILSNMEFSENSYTSSPL